jgi:Predicted acetyltransferase
MVSSEATIRPMTADDIGEVYTVQRAAFVVEAQRYDDPHLPPLVETVDEIRDDLRSCVGLVAVCDGRLVGSVRVRADGDQLQIGRLSVAPDLHGRGLGAQLLAAAEHVLPGRTAVLFTGDRSASNLHLYTSRGYVETGRVEVPGGVVLIHLAKPLQ